MSFPLLFARIPFSYLPIPSSALLKKCFVNLQFTYQSSLVTRFPQAAREICTKYRAGAYGRNGAKRAPPFWVCGCNMPCAHFDTSPCTGPPPGQESHLPSLGDVMYKSLQLGDAGNVPPVIPSHAPLQSRRCPLSPRAYSKYRPWMYCQGL